MHYAILIILIIVILAFQVTCYVNVRRQIGKFFGIFPGEEKKYNIKIVHTDSENRINDSRLQTEANDGISQIEVEDASPVMEKILTALNIYLKKNHGAASDFNLMKDVVERYCDAEEESISTQQPIPLYLGLMGTMLGIIVGIAAISWTGDFSNDLMKNIGDLMKCVAVAMAASLVGVLCTTLIAWYSKSAVAKVEADKNRFYSWMQTELLPVLSGDAVNALYMMQQNLMSFNQTFKSNISNLDDVLQKISDTSREQVALVNLVKDIDIKQVAQANIRVLKELKDCVAEIQVFNQYMQNVSSYLNAVNALNSSLNAHLDRTAAIERMGNFFESEIAQVSAREQYINQVVANVDDTLKKTFESLSESTRMSVSELKVKSVTEFDEISGLLQKQMDAFREALGRQQQEMSAALLHRNEEFAACLDSQQKAVSEKNIDLDRIMEKISMIADVKDVLQKIADKMEERQPVQIPVSQDTSVEKLPRYVTVTSILLGLAMLLATFTCIWCLFEMWMI